MSIYLQHKIENTIDFFNFVCYTILYKTNRYEESMTTLNFALDAQKYTVCRALLWGNCAGHFKKAFGSEALSGGHRFVHLLIAALELIPIVGQVASLFETAIIRGLTTKLPAHNFTTIEKFEGTQGDDETPFDCTICYEDLRLEGKTPVILEGDGRTYEKDSIENWLNTDHTVVTKVGSDDGNSDEKFVGKTTPLNLVLDTPEKQRLHSNRIVQMKDPICPITKEAFKEPYFCVENGQTYEKEAVERFFRQNFTVHSKLTLIPNRILFPENSDIPTETIVLEK